MELQTCRLSSDDASRRLPARMADLGNFSRGSSMLKLRRRVCVEDISATERSFPARIGASRPRTCCLSRDEASRKLPVGTADLGNFSRDSSMLKIRWRVCVQDISVTERSFRALIGASGPQTCPLSSDDASGTRLARSADLYNFGRGASMLKIRRKV